MKHPVLIYIAILFFIGTELRSQVTVDAGPDLVLNCNTTSIEITPIVTGAINPSYSWNGPSVSNYFELAITIDLPGVYSITVTDQANGNTATDEVVVTLDNTAPVINLIVTQACFGQGTGAMEVQPQGNQIYQWSNGSTGSAINNLQPGTYCVTVMDVNNGCTATECAVIVQTLPISVTGTVQSVSCHGAADGSIAAVVTGGIPTYTYLWSNSTTTQTITNLTSGIYSLTVTDGAGCTQQQDFLVGQPAPFVITTSSSCDNTLWVLPVGGTPPFAYSWSGPNGFNSTVQNPMVPGPGVYNITITDANGCSSVASYSITPSDEPCTKIYGRAVYDANQDCMADTQEISWANLVVRAAGANGTFYAMTDSAGQYSIYVVPGDYTVSALPNDPLALVCPFNPGVTLPALGDSVKQDFSISGINPDCPLMKVDLTTSLLRRCFSNNFYWVNYCNLRPVDAPGAYIDLTLDPFLSIVNSTLPHTSLGNNVYRFDLGTVGPNECGNFWVQVHVSCNAVLGQTHCSEVHIYPDTLCNPVDPLWSGAEVGLRSECLGDSLYFILKNIGTATMSDQLEYIVIEDGLMNRAGTAPPLAPGAEMIISVPANGATWRVEAEQEPLLPRFSLPVLSVEGCATSGVFSTGFVEQFPANDYDAWVDIECRANQGSYDPNDKQGFPTGYGAEHYVKPGTEIEYLIRFQNTGTDTAFNVYILDTLSAWLDPASVQPGASSHSYKFELRGEGTLLFEFPNIMLPDSNINEPASNGFVKFRIRPRTTVPLETDIFNSAAIYFDFNEPIITNTTQHRIGENFITVAIWEPWSPQYQVSVSPNPAFDHAVIRLIGNFETGNYQLVLTDLNSRPVRTLHDSNGSFEFQRSDLPAGMYVFQIRKDGNILGTGKLILR